MVNELNGVLLSVIRSERQRWYELKEYAAERGDYDLLEAMHQASVRYGERSRQTTVISSQLTDDRRPLYQITDSAIRELRYRELFYGAEHRAVSSLADMWGLVGAIRDVELPPEVVEFIESRLGMTMEEWRRTGVS